MTPRPTVAAVLLALVLTGCSDDPDPDPSPAPGNGEDATTMPGTALPIGDTATVPLADGVGVIDLRVAGVEAGDPGLLQDLDGTPYFVRLEATAVSGDARPFFPAGSVVAYAGDTLVAPLATPLTVGSCERTGWRTTPAIGTTLKTCLTFVVESGGPALDLVAWNEEPYSIDDDSALTWE